MARTDPTVTDGAHTRIPDDQDTPRDTRKGKIPVRHVRVVDSLWNAATAKAHDEGENISTVVRQLLREYVRD